MECQMKLLQYIFLVFSDNFPVLSGLLAMGFFIHNAVVTLFKHSANQKKIVSIILSFLTPSFMVPCFLWTWVRSRLYYIYCQCHCYMGTTDIHNFVFPDTSILFCLLKNSTVIMRGKQEVCLYISVRHRNPKGWIDLN